MLSYFSGYAMQSPFYNSIELFLDGSTRPVREKRIALLAEVGRAALEQDLLSGDERPIEVADRQ